MKGKIIPPRPQGKAGRPCECCARPALARDLLSFLKTRAAGKTEITLNGYYWGRVLVEFDDPPSFGSVRGHALRCLGRHHLTGKPLR